MFEIEIKAWDKKTAETEKTVASFADYECFFDKTDVYYKQTVPPKQSVRLRIEKTIIENCKPVEKNWVTYKQKEKLPSGVEVNQEIEFEVSSGESFIQMLEGCGFAFSFRKHKKAKSFHFGSYHIELVEIEGLGSFVEIETLCEDKTEATVKKAQNELFEVLEKCGISKADIEERYYSDMLKEKQA